MKLVFLDFDGVIVHSKCRKTPQSLHVDCADRQCIARLKKILDETGAKILIHSTWAYYSSPDELECWMRKYGIGPEYFHPDKVCVIGEQESEEHYWDRKKFAIHKFLDAHPEVTHVAVLEDDRIFELEDSLNSKLVFIPSGWSRGGIQDQQVEEAINLLT